MIIYEGEKLNLSIADAEEYAESLGLQLRKVREDPVVYKIMDYNRKNYKKNKSKRVKTKHFKLSPKTEENDIAIKLKKALKCLEKGNNVVFSMTFKGRERDYLLNALPVMTKIADSLGKNYEVSVQTDQIIVKRKN